MIDAAARQIIAQGTCSDEDNNICVVLDYPNMVIVRVAFVEKVTTVIYAVQATAFPPMAVVGTLKVAPIVAAFQK